MSGTFSYRKRAITHTLLLILIAASFASGCKEENITQIVGPEDWQGPTVEWTSPMDAEVRGTIGLDVSVHDSSSILRVKLYMNGREDQTLTDPPFRFTIITDSFADGVHLCEARAWDQYENLGISPILRVNVANSVAQGPRVLWVSDSFQTIQAAINAATDFDTIRVRDGIYYETLNTFGKGIWIESEHGPMTCTIDAAGSNSVFTISPNRIFCVLRGFALTGGDVIVRPENGGQVNLFNNILLSDSGWTLWFSTYCAATIHNNLFLRSRAAVQIGYTWGSFYNNIIMDASQYGLWNAAIYRNPLEYGYNIFWQNQQNYAFFSPGIGDTIADPMVDLVNGELSPDSPAINRGNPSIVDRDNTRSDIGPFGGPYAY